jgi:hypothetical protein
MSQSFLNSGTLVILCTRVLLCTGVLLLCVVVCCWVFLCVVVCCCVLEGCGGLLVAVLCEQVFSIHSVGIHGCLLVGGRVL